MLLVPGLRDVGAVVLFVAMFATTVTAVSVLARSSPERAFLHGVTASAPPTLGTTGNPTDGAAIQLATEVGEARLAQDVHEPRQADVAAPVASKVPMLGPTWSVNRTGQW
jgi:hypothetical protein